MRTAGGQRRPNAGAAHRPSTARIPRDSPPPGGLGGPGTGHASWGAKGTSRLQKGRGGPGPSARARRRAASYRLASVGGVGDGDVAPSAGVVPARCAHSPDVCRAVGPGGGRRAAFQCDGRARGAGPQVRVFNVGKYRRNIGDTGDANFFDPSNESAVEQRQQAAAAAMEDMLKFFREGGEVGIFDATNSTRARRQWILDQAKGHGIAVVFIESICDDPEVLQVHPRRAARRWHDGLHGTPSTPSPPPPPPVHPPPPSGGGGGGGRHSLVPRNTRISAMLHRTATVRRRYQSSRAPPLF